MLYGIKSIAISKINEFFYGVRETRFRKNAKGETEDEPLIYLFWQACAHAHVMGILMPMHMHLHLHMGST